MAMFELLRVAIALVGSAAAGLWDLKTTDIPDWVCIVMAFSGIVLFAAEGWLMGDFSGLTSSLLVGGLFAAFGIGMYLTGQWGGGDGELMAAIGLLLPFWPFATSSLFPLPFAFFVNIFFVGTIYTVIYAGVLIFTKPKLKSAVIKTLKSDAKMIASLTFGASLAFAAIWTLTGMLWLIVLPVLAAILPTLYRVLKIVEASFSVRIPVKKLKVGDMIGEDIHKLNLLKRHIRGLTLKDIRRIRSVRSSVLIREGVRFGPVFPLALAMTLAVGDFATFIISVL